jgi:hypothetical protein
MHPASGMEQHVLWWVWPLTLGAVSTGSDTVVNGVPDRRAWFRCAIARERNLTIDASFTYFLLFSAASAASGNGMQAHRGSQTGQVQRACDPVLPAPR